MSSYTLPSSSTSLCPEEVALSAEAVEALTAAGTAMVVAVPLSALTCPVREGSTGAGSGGDGRSALVVAGAQAIRSGEPVAFCKVLAVAPAVVRRDGRVQADGRPCEQARLGVLEQELDRRCGPGTIDQVAAGVRLTGKIKGQKCRELSVPFVIRATVLMTLIPEADTREVLTALLGDLPAVPWRRPHPVPSATALSTWRAAIGPAPLQDLRRRVLTAAVAEHRDGAGGAGGAGGPAGCPAGIEVGGGLRVGAIDGTVTRMPDNKANRTAFGSTGSGDPRAGFPQIRSLHGTDAFTRTGLFTVAGPAGTDKAQAEQKLLDKAVDEHPEVFGPHQLWIMDRNFPGVPRIKKMLEAQTHVLIRVKSDIRLDRIGEFAPDGSYPARLSGGGVTLTVRVIEYHVTLDGATTPELFCLITDLLDHTTHPAHLLAAAYRWRWDGSETALREAKSTIHDAGPGTGAMLRSRSPELIHQEHAAWTVGVELVRALTRSAAAVAAPVAKGPRTGQPVQARQLSFTTARRTAVATVRAGTATATLPAPARTGAHRAALDLIATARVTTDRHRHRPHKIKTRQAFGHASRDITTRTVPAVVHVCGATTPPPTAA